MKNRNIEDKYRLHESLISHIETHNVHNMT